MSRLGPVLQTLRRRGEAALVPFLTAGDPDLDTTLRLALAVEAAGADEAAAFVGGLKAAMRTQKKKTA